MKKERAVCAGDDFMRSVVARTDGCGLRVSRLSTQPERIEFLKRLNGKATSLSHLVGVPIECLYPQKGLVGLLVLDVEWRPESFQLYLSIEDVQIDPEFKYFAKDALRALSQNLEEVIFERWGMSVYFLPVVIIDVDVSLPDAREWCDVLSEGFEIAQKQGSLTLVKREGNRNENTYENATAFLAWSETAVSDFIQVLEDGSTFYAVPAFERFAKENQLDKATLIAEFEALTELTMIRLKILSGRHKGYKKEIAP